MNIKKRKTIKKIILDYKGIVKLKDQMIKKINYITNRRRNNEQNIKKDSKRFY